MCNSSHTCIANKSCPGQTFNPCTNACEGTMSLLKLGFDSVSSINTGTPVLQSANPALFALSNGSIGVGAIAPNDTFSIGVGGIAAPAGSAGTGHNNTLTYLSTDDYALVNYGIVKTLISNATSTITSVWSGTLSGNIWNGNSGNVGIGTTVPETELHINDSTGNSAIRLSGGAVNNETYQMQQGIDGVSNGGFAIRDVTNSINRFVIQYSTGNVGIGTTGPGDKLDIQGNLRIGNDATNGQTIKFYGVSGDGAGSYDHTVIAERLYSGSDYSELLLFKGNDIGAGPTDRIRLDTPGNILFQTGNGARSYSPTVGGLDRLIITSAGLVGVGTIGPNDVFSIGTSGGTAAPAGSDRTGHNNTLTYLSADKYALANYGLVETLVNNSLSSFLPLAGGTMTGDVNFGGKSITNLANLTVTKINANTIDPLYTINNTNYSTFASSISGGVKEEYTGKASIKRLNPILNEYEYIINFDSETEGSDLWVWHKVVDYSDNNIQAFITPSGKFANVYYLVSGNKLIFRSDKPVDVSYRLIGRRFDWREWPTKAIDQKSKGMLVN